MSSSAVNQRFTLAKKPSGLPTADVYQLESLPVPTAEEGQIVLRAQYVSVDPYLRHTLDSLPIGAPVVSGQVSEVVESKNSDFKVGEKVQRYGAWARYEVVTPPVAGSPESASPFTQLNKVAADESAGIPLSAYLGVLGMPGMTAYFGLKEVAAFKKGDVVLVSGAAGAVGSLVGQLAKLWGAKLVIGSAGGKDKCNLVVEKYGFDACIDYKEFDTQAKVVAELKRISPDGVDLYFDNTGGHVSDAFYDVVRKFARAAICGQIASYNAEKAVSIPSPFMKLIYTSVTIRGFVVFDYAERLGEFFKAVTPLVKEKKIVFQETVVEGFEKIPEALLGLFTGANIGKMIVKV